MEMSRTRRKVLAATAATGLSLSTGCIGSFIGREAADDLELSNHAGAERNGAFEITHVESGTVAYSDSFTVADGELEGYGNILTRGGEYEIDIEADGLSETYRWTERDEDDTLEDDGLLVQIFEDRFNFKPFE